MDRTLITDETPVFLWDTSGTVIAQWIGYKLPEWLGTILTATHGRNERHPIFPNLNQAMVYTISWKGMPKVPVPAGYPLAIALQMALIENSHLRDWKD